MHKKFLIAAGLAKGEEVNATEKNILIEGSGGAAGEGGSLRKMALYKRWEGEKPGVSDQEQAFVQLRYGAMETPLALTISPE